MVRKKRPKKKAKPKDVLCVFPTEEQAKREARETEKKLTQGER